MDFEFTDFGGLISLFFYSGCFGDFGRCGFWVYDIVCVGFGMFGWDFFYLGCCKTAFCVSEWFCEFDY